MNTPAEVFGSGDMEAALLVSMRPTRLMGRLDGRIAGIPTSPADGAAELAGVKSSVITLLGLTGTSSEIVAGGASDICAEPTLAAAAETAGTKQVKDTRVTTKREKMLGILKSGLQDPRSIY